MKPKGRSHRISLQDPLLAATARARAAKLGISLSEYIQRLIETDIKPQPAQLTVTFTNPATLKGLHYFEKQFPWLDGRHDLRAVLVRVLALALAHPSVVSAWHSAAINYCKAEAIDQKDFLIKQILARPEYRRIKLPA